MLFAAVKVVAVPEPAVAVAVLSAAAAAVAVVAGAAAAVPGQVSLVLTAPKATFVPAVAALPDVGVCVQTCQSKDNKM